MPTFENYYGDWKTRDHTCTCGWEGSGSELSTELFEALIEASCPKCDRHLVLVSFSSSGETRAAAAAGNDEAASDLPMVEMGEQLRERFQREELHEASQLPDVEGAILRFVIDIKGDGVGLDYYVITLGDREVWREPAGWEDWQRFNELKAFLKERYGSRFAALTPTTAAAGNLLGDNISVSLNRL